jgi:GTPase SAR1 family protein
MSRQGFTSSGDVCLALAQVLEDLGETDLLALTRLLGQRLATAQSYVTVVGETSSGKSTLINGLFEEPLLPAAVTPTTGTVTQVVCKADGATEYLAINRDGTQEELDPTQFMDLAQVPDEGLLRLQLRTRPGSPRYNGLNIFDTPGYNSLLAEHEEVLRTFLPESDAIVFVAGYRSGFGQVDQDLFEVARSAVDQDPDIPMLLVINRVPPGTGEGDRRVQEIARNAADSLRRSAQTLLVESVPLDDQGRWLGRPMTDPMWKAVRACVAEPARLIQVQAKLDALLSGIVKAGLDAAKRRQWALEVSETDLANIEAQIRELEQTRREALDRVDACEERLILRLEPTLKHGTGQFRKRVEREIQAAGKWVGPEDCVPWINGHVFPEEVRLHSGSLTQILVEELERLDRELEELANTAVGKIERQTSIKGEAARALVANLTGSLLAGGVRTILGSLLESLGGVGGAAAGTGNLAKMILSRGGKAVGVGFSRETYNAIGRIFNKRLIKYGGAVFAAVIEGVLFIIEANRWKGQLQEKALEAIEQWRVEVGRELFQTQLPAITKGNRKGIATAYDQILAEPRKWREERRTTTASARVGLAMKITLLEQFEAALADITEKR